MAKTEIRRLCTACNKRNLCTYKKDGKLLTRCMTDGCKGLQQEAQPVQEQNTNTFIDSKKLEFLTPDRYRGISKQTLEFGGCRVATVGSTTATEYDHNNLDGTYSKKTGFRPSKAFMWEGKTDTTSMYLLNKCTDFTRPLYITEGNEDALSLWELGFQACSIHSAGTERENIELDLETILKFPEIVICIENDRAGKKAKKTIKEMLSMKLLREVDLSPRKDANEWIRDDLEDQAPDREELINRLHKAKEILPKGVIFGDMISSEELRKPLPKGVQLPYPKLQEVVKGGILPGDLWLLCAGVSIGKSSVIRDFCADFQKQGLKIGNIFVEESKQVSQLNYIATELGYPIGDVLVDPTIIPQDQWDSCMQKILNTNNLMFIDEYWDRTTDNLLKTIEYLAKVKKYDIIVLDHITAVINSSGVGRGGKVHDIDWLMEQLFNLCRQTGVRLFIVSHLKRPQQPPYWDEGKKPSMYDLRGCVDEETEVLTDKGWLKISNYRDEKIAEYNLHTSMVDFKLPKDYIKKPSDGFYHLNSIRGIDMMLSKEHTVIYSHNNAKNLGKMSAEELVKKNKDSRTGYRGRFLTTFKVKDNTSIKISDELLRLAIAYQADGTYSKKSKRHCFKFTKERKYIRLKQLLDTANIEYRDYGKFPCGQYCVEMQLPIALKEFPKEWYSLNTHQAFVVVDEVKYWDGELLTGRYVTTSKDNADFIQYCYTITGVRSTLSIQRKAQGVWSTLYRVSPSSNNTVCLANKDKKPEIKEVKGSKNKYCFTTSTGAWVARRNGRIFITGNSGSLEGKPDVILGLSRNMKDEYSADVLSIEVLKNRWFSKLGMVDDLVYLSDSGRLILK